MYVYVYVCVCVYVRVCVRVCVLSLCLCLWVLFVCIESLLTFVSSVLLSVFLFSPVRVLSLPVFSFSDTTIMQRPT